MCNQIHSSSTLYNLIFRSIANGTLQKVFRASDLRNLHRPEYALSTYSTFLPKHCCDGKCRLGKNVKGYKIYFKKIERGGYSLLCDDTCPNSNLNCFG